jgi:L-iditol 2-dehydrogenase
VEMTPSLKLNDSVLVLGTGTIGLLIIQTLRLRGCGNIIAVDLDEGKLQMARRIGADYTFSPRTTDVAVEVAALTEGRGADRAFEAVGISSTIMTAIESVRKGGSITLVGNISPKADLPLQQIVTRQIQIYSSCASSGEYPACLEMIARGSIDVKSLISKTVPLKEGGKWFLRLHKQEQGLMKVILCP